jgi:NADH dehydrogenase
VLLDRRNYHLFQPLLYQVATAALNPSDIAEPIRRVLRRPEERAGAPRRGDRASTSSAAA